MSKTKRGRSPVRAPSEKARPGKVAKAKTAPDRGARRPSKAERAATERRRAQRRRLGGILIAVAAVAVFAVVAITAGGGNGGAGPSGAGEVAFDGPSRTAPLAVGEAVPGFSGPGLTGGHIAWSDVAGEPTVLAVWAPWCPHCQVELPVLGRVADEFPAVRVLTVVTAIGESPGPDPLEFMEDNGLTFPTVVDDGDRTILQGLGVTGFPTAFYVGSDGVVRQVTSGETDEQELRALFGALD